MTTATNHPTPELLSESALAEIEAREAVASTVISDLNHGRARWRLSVPARPDADPDLMISASLRDIPALCATVRALQEANKALARDVVTATNQAHKYRDESESLRNQQWTVSRVIAWLDDPLPKPAIHAFTEGNERQIAYRVEYLRDQLAELQRRNDTQAESIMEFQAGEKSLRAQLAQAEKELTKEKRLRSELKHIAQIGIEEVSSVGSALQANAVRDATDRATTRMRDKCVVTAREREDVWRNERYMNDLERRRFNAYAEEAAAIATALESLTLDQVEQK